MNITRCGGLAAICALFFCLGLAGAALAADPGKKPDGFRGIAWGTEASSLKDMTLVETDGEFTDYDRKGDKKDLGGMPVAMVTYGFYKGKFYHAAIAYEGTTGFDAVQEHLAAKYGPPDAVAERTDDAGRAYVLAAWNWPGYAYIGHRRYKDGSAGRVFYFYSPLVEASKAAAASSVATAAMDPQAPGAGKAPATQAKPRPGSDEKPGKPEPVARPSSPAPAAPAVQDEAAPSLADKASTRPAPTIPAEPGQGRTHVVEKGDMLSALAKRYGVPRNDILAANPGINPTNLKLGQTLIIPAGGKAPAVSEPQAAVTTSAAAPEAHAPPVPEAKPAQKPHPPMETAAAPETAPASVSGEEARPVQKAPSEAVKTPATEKKAAPGTHIIVQGDMISGLAKRYGVTEKDILKANPGLKASNLKLGAVVRLPHGATLGAAEPHGAAEVAASAPEPKTEPRTEPKPEPRTEPKLESKPEAKAEGNAEPSPGPKAEAAPEMAAPPAKPGPKADSTAQAGVETKPEPTPQPAPEATPRVAGPEPGTAPKAETRQAAPNDGQKAQAARPREHVLEFDDTVSGLAKRYGVTEKAILKANPGLDSRKLKPGRKIKIP
ncbi:LysM peptidoglycan-binding domain-containing protein [Desulfovibrio sulfodismutans]|uniref:LysM peptidoglycan-binding domain-containing protein n=1 Tax=Desulfolutivibrio sulfodismutans TaxID=63561 RepID=A0A7K3NSF7_9BACT|nr:LysM peptidoglycan-binding domain-containing protein [Desulfolutivibrio sulfodismutans]NDY58735.1 LysM peptidoglycan-binding domain-containing protein [Desulfolutivibrio sulfodismutans]QLA14137.1 LysM peptidoglycan-binding domain-containing protein [Desulfolutivibrio sulfodismutans DSM 3696]